MADPNDAIVFFKKQISNLARSNAFRLSQIVACLNKEEMYSLAYQEMETAHKEMVMMRRLMLQIINRNTPAQAVTPPTPPWFTPPNKPEGA